MPNFTNSMKDDYFFSIFKQQMGMGRVWSYSSDQKKSPYFTVL